MFDNLLFVLLDLFFELKYLIGTDDKFLLGLGQCQGELVVEIFKHDVVLFLHFSHLQQVVQLFLYMFELLNVPKLKIG